MYIIDCTVVYLPTRCITKPYTALVQPMYRLLLHQQCTLPMLLLNGSIIGLHIIMSCWQRFSNVGLWLKAMHSNSLSLTPANLLHFLPPWVECVCTLYIVWHCWQLHKVNCMNIMHNIQPWVNIRAKIKFVLQYCWNTLKLCRDVKKLVATKRTVY